MIEDLTPEQIELIKQSGKFIKVVDEVIKKRGITYDFTCPVCGGQAHGIRVKINGHIHAWCDSCGIGVGQ